MKKRMLTWLLAVTLVITSLPGMAYATSVPMDSAMPYASQSPEHVTRTTHLILDPEKSDSNASEGWSWDADTHTLTLNNTNIITTDCSSGISGPIRTLILKGSNSVICTGEKSISEALGHHGIYFTRDSYSADSVILGDGELTVIGANGYGSSSALEVFFGTLYINGGTIIAQGGSCSERDSYGICAASVVINGGIVTARGGTATSQRERVASYGIYTTGTTVGLTVNGGILTASSGNGSDEASSCAISVLSTGGFHFGAGVTISEPAEWTIKETSAHSTHSAVFDASGQLAKTVVIQGPDISTPVLPQSPSISLSSVTINSHQVPTVVWDPVEGAANYSITIQDTESGRYLFHDDLIPGSVNSFLLDYVDFVEGNTYEIYVKAIDAAGNESEPSNTITFTKAAQIEDPSGLPINQSNVFRKQEKSDTCTYAAATNMLRRRAILDNVSNWDSIFVEGPIEKVARNPGPLGGMKWDFTYYGMRVKCPGTLKEQGYSTIAQKKNYFISMLEQHPEGIVVYSKESSALPDGNKIATHAILLTDYDSTTDTFYCADPASIYAGVGRMKLTDSSIFRDRNKLPVKTYTQDEIIDALDQIWYVYSVDGQKVLTSSKITSHCPVDMILTVDGKALLDSREITSSATAGHATMTVSGVGDEKTVEVNIAGDDAKTGNLAVSLVGNGTGTMTFNVEHMYSDGSTETQTFVDVPLTETTIGNAISIYPQSTVLLYMTDKEQAAVWAAAPKEKVTVPTADFEEYDSISDITDNNTTTPANPGGNTSGNTGGYVPSPAPSPEVWANPFADVTSNSWYLDAVKFVSEQGLMEGVSTTTFAPDANLTRAQLVTVLWRLDGKPSVAAADFTDVAANQWFADPIAWAASNKIVTGYGNGTFGPDDSITREQVAAILYRYAQYKKYDTVALDSLTNYTDAGDVDGYAVDAMKWANGSGIITGTTKTTLVPRGTATRAQVAAVLMRFCENIVK